MTVAALDVDFYISSTDGPTLRFAGGSDGMKILRGACQHLADGERSVRFSDVDGVSLSQNVESIEFRLDGTGGLCRQSGHPRVFVFEGDRLQWGERALLLDPLIQPGSLGTFQLLEPNAVEGICVEASVTR